MRKLESSDEHSSEWKKLMRIQNQQNNASSNRYVCVRIDDDDDDIIK